MWHKRHWSQDAEAPAGKRLRENIADLYTSGDIAGDRAQSLFEDAGDFADSLGSHEMQDLRGGRFAGSVKNQNRDLRRKLLRRSRWPPLYLQEVRSWSVKHKRMEMQKLAVLLPHEVVAVLGKIGQPDVLCEAGGLDAWNLVKHQEIYDRLQVPFVSISLWGDGVPFSWDRKHSADTWTISLPGLVDKQHRDLRICLTAMPHQCVVRETQDDLFRILAWSFNALAMGRYPTERADGLPWQPEDAWRQKQGGEPLLHGALIELKGDWKQLHHCFAMPSWSQAPHKPICWRCSASKASLKLESGADSSWLRPENRLSHVQGLQRILDEGGELSPAFSIPWLTLRSFRIDWLHVADQGVTAVFMGGLFHMILSSRNYGPNEDTRLGWLWAEIQAFYDREGSTDRLHTLTKTMVKPKSGSIELTGGGAQIRGLVPFCLQLVNSFEAPLSEEMFTARAAMRSLQKCYTYLSVDRQVEGETLLDCALAYHSAVRRLHELHPKRWQLRPKLHLFLELCAEDGPPSSSWNYREESFGGSVSRQSHHRGGHSSLLSMSRTLLTKFCAKEALPRLVG